MQVYSTKNTLKLIIYTTKPYSYDGLKHKYNNNIYIIIIEFVYSLNYVLTTYGLNEELGRHRGREGKCICNLCSEECESVCPVYSECRALFSVHLKIIYGNNLSILKVATCSGEIAFHSGNRALGNHYEALLHLVKSYIIDIWELCKSKLYGSGTGPLQHRSRPGRDTACQGKGKFGKVGGGKSFIVVYGSARSSGCKAHGPSAMATI